jgi:Bacterial PH domain
VEWSPRPAGTVVRLLAAAALAAAATLVVDDAPGRLLVGLAAAGLLVDAAHDVLARPRLAARPEGGVARTWSGRRRVPWPDLRVRVRATRRLGVVVRTLELDSEGPADDGTLVVLGRRDVGAPVDDVARQLRGLRQETLG